MYEIGCSISVAAGFVRQLSKLNSNQCRTFITERNGPGGSGTHDLSSAAAAF